MLCEIWIGDVVGCLDVMAWIGISGKEDTTYEYEMMKL